MRCRLLPVIAAAVALTAVSPAAQNRPQDAQATFRTGTRLVQISIVVHDGRGRPVSGLTADDFRVLEDGKEQRIALFSVEDGRTDVAAADTSDTGVFTNRIDGPAATGVTIILFDRLNTRFEHLQQARGHIIRFLGQLRPEDRVGFYVLDGDSVKVLHDFTRDASSLLRALERTRATTSRELAGSEEKLVRPEPTGEASVDAELNAWLDRSEQAIQAFYLRKRIEASAGALEGIARHLAGVRGRKNIIWISSGFPIFFSDGPGIGLASMSPEVYRAARALSHSDIAIYPVDARGLVGAFATPPSAKQQQFTTLGSVMPNIETSQLVAEQTGGRAFYNTNDLGDAITRAVRDTSLTYMIGYYPQRDEWDGGFRRIQVSVKRRGLDVRHRRGYYAFPPMTAEAGAKQAAMSEALKSPLEATGIGLRVEIDQAAAPDQYLLTLHVAADAITLLQKDGAWDGTVDFTIAQALPDGRLFRSFETTVPLRFTDEVRAQFLKEGLTLNRTITLRPDVHQVRIVLRDGTTGGVGSLIVPASRLRERAPR